MKSHRGLTITMVINHALTKWNDPPSIHPDLRLFQFVVRASGGFCAQRNGATLRGENEFLIFDFFGSEAREKLGGGFEYFLFSRLPGEMILFHPYFSNGLKSPTRRYVVHVERSMPSLRKNTS